MNSITLNNGTVVKLGDTVRMLCGGGSGHKPVTGKVTSFVDPYSLGWPTHTVITWHDGIVSEVASYAVYFERGLKLDVR